MRFSFFFFVNPNEWMNDWRIERYCCGCHKESPQAVNSLLKRRMNTGVFLCCCCCYCSLCRLPSNSKRNNKSNFILHYKCILLSAGLLCQHICPHIVCNMQAFSQSQQVKTKWQKKFFFFFFWNTLRNLWHVSIQNELNKKKVVPTGLGCEIFYGDI